MKQQQPSRRESLGNDGFFQRKKRHTIEDDENTLERADPEEDLLNRSYRNKINQPLVSNKACERLNKSVDRGSNRDRLEKNKRLAIEEEELKQQRH